MFVCVECCKECVAGCLPPAVGHQFVDVMLLWHSRPLLAVAMFIVAVASVCMLFTSRILKWFAIRHLRLACEFGFHIPNYGYFHLTDRRVSDLHFLTSQTNNRPAGPTPTVVPKQHRCQM